ncbi:TetR/AcrR family transcriptional regulator [Catellatospora chokoriensis]|uniref:TetR family transcriptional regulator n=1 Tax=Catellatospora chokoriensis TaxID=310353 RepID=A0A8J3NPG9_9ACTN|nr:TetR family transcriptional regulator [Catellatospora chokoriensis]GIF88182.1 TetR family transcriptional regulator [Catellatospora chokoriensis]
MTVGQQGRGPSIWARPQRGARGPSPEYRLADIAAAAIRLASAGGLAAVSMRAVAGELNTTASTLYRYVTSRDELLDLMVDTAMAGFAHTRDSDEDWLGELVRIAEATRSLYVAQPWLLDAVPTSSAPGPHTLRWFEHCLQAMAALDRTTRQKMEAVGVLNGVIMLFARSAAAPTALDFGAVDPARHPLLAAVLTGSAPGSPTADLFERTIRALLGGLLAG